VHYRRHTSACISPTVYFAVLFQPHFQISLTTTTWWWWLLWLSQKNSLVFFSSNPDVFEVLVLQSRLLLCFSCKNSLANVAHLKSWINVINASFPAPHLEMIVCVIYEQQTHMYTHTHTHAHTCTAVHMNTHIHTCTHAQMHTRVHTCYTHICTHTHVHTHTRTHTCTHPNTC